MAIFLAPPEEEKERKALTDSGNKPTPSETTKPPSVIQATKQEVEAVAVPKVAEAEEDIDGAPMEGVDLDKLVAEQAKVLIFFFLDHLFSSLLLVDGTG